MNTQDVKPGAPQLSRIRTFLFWALAFVWFSEMVLWGFFANIWTYVWHVIPPENPQLAMALFITWAVAAPAKGALCVMAVFGARSKDPFARTVLFASMALIPPLNIAFPFRQQGFLFSSVAVATIFSIILWGSFFLFREPAQRPEQKGIRGSGQLPPSRWEIFQYVWFTVNAAALTLMAFLFLFWPGTALHLIFPCLSTMLNASQGELFSLIHSCMASGTHLLALAIASWIATLYCRSNPPLRQALTMGSAVLTGLFFIFPLRQIFLEFGGNCTTSSILIIFVPLFVGWVVYGALSYRKKIQESSV